MHVTISAAIVIKVSDNHMKFLDLLSVVVNDSCLCFKVNLVKLTGLHFVSQCPPQKVTQLLVLLENVLDVQTVLLMEFG